jgi:3-oxoacyl-[acyl-carrier-protein] synthase-1
LSPKIRISGMGLSCALGRGVAACAEALEQGRVNTVEVELKGLSEPVKMPYYRIPDGADLFDPSRFETLILEAAAEALKGAGLKQAELAALPVFVGSSAFTISLSEHAMAASLAKGGQALALPHVGFQQIAELSRRLGVGGAAYAFNTACTSAANALMTASRMLRLGRHAHALVLGVELANLTTLAGFSGLQLIASELKPFDLKRGGIVLGEGIGAVLLSAASEGAGGFSIAGACSNSDTHSVTTANPDGSSIAALEAELLRSSGVEASEILALKSHGTASPMNDTGEAAGMRRVFNPLPPLLALKPYIGHTLGACGANELVLLCAALERGFLPAVPGFETLDPLLGVTPLLKKMPSRPGLSMLNFFGFGGNNAALLLRQEP